MKVLTKQDVLNISKPEGINATYYLFNEYEVHYNEQLPHTTQTWHHHEKIWETLFIIEGELTAKWRENNEEKEQVVKTDDLIETERTSHTFINHTNQMVKFLVIKQVLRGEDKKDLFKTDKVIDQA